VDDSNLMNIVLHLTKKYNIKLNNLKKQPLSRNETELNIWNEANIQYFKELFEYKNSLKIKMWWERLTKKPLKLKELLKDAELSVSNLNILI